MTLIEIKKETSIEDNIINVQKEMDNIGVILKDLGFNKLKVNVGLLVKKAEKLTKTFDLTDKKIVE